jgi:hypothetical protein
MLCDNDLQLYLQFTYVQTYKHVHTHKMTCVQYMTQHEYHVDHKEGKEVTLLTT